MANTSRINNGNGYFKEEVTITATQNVNKEITLSKTPANPNQVMVTPVSGTVQKYNTDFIVIGNILSWNGKGLETILTIGDTLVITYQN